MKNVVTYDANWARSPDLCVGVGELWQRTKQGKFSYYRQFNNSFITELHKTNTVEPGQFTTTSSLWPLTFGP